MKPCSSGWADPKSKPEGSKGGSAGGLTGSSTRGAGGISKAGGFGAAGAGGSGIGSAAPPAWERLYSSKASLVIATYSPQRVHLNLMPDPVILSSETRKSLLQPPQRTSILNG